MVALPLAAVPPPDLNSLVLVLAAAALGALLSRLHRHVVLPTVVVEIVLGIAIGPDVLGWASADAYITFLSGLGLAFLFPEGLGLAALFLVLLLVVRGASALLWLRELSTRRTVGLAIFAATGLPLIVAIVGIGTERSAISAQVGASLIGAGMISVLVFPVLAGHIVGRGNGAAPERVEQYEY